MEKIKKSSNIAAKIAKVFRTFCIIGIVFSVLGAICGFVMNGYIKQYYQNADNLMAAQGSLDADMGVFSFLPFDSLKASGNYGVFFAVQLLCLAIVLCAYIYLFTVLKTTMENIRDTGRAYPDDCSLKAKKKYIAITIMLLLFSGLVEAVIAGIVLCGLYNVTSISDR